MKIRYLRKNNSLTKRSRIKRNPASVFLWALFLPIFVASCLLSEPRESGKNTSNAAATNNPATLNVGESRVMITSPYAQKGSEVDYNSNLSAYLDKTAQFITYNDRLFEACAGDGLNGNVITCYEVREEANAVAIGNNQGTWGYELGTTEWLQVQNFYHMKTMINRFHKVMLDVFKNQAQPTVAPPLNPYLTSFPQDLYTTYGHWYGNQTMLSYADAGIENNAFFSPTTFSTSYGHLSNFPHIFIVMDPSVIYHEMGHALSQVMLNVRNVAQGIPERVDISYASYDESGAIQEGLADYFSYIMNGRSRFGEFSLGQDLNAARPVTEDDGLHAPGISSDAEFRLKYPEHLSYEPNSPALTIEDVHNAGMITSHFLTTFHKDLQSQCGLSFDAAGDMVLYFIMETYAELGDLSSTASDHSEALNSTRPTRNHRSDVDDAGVRISEEWVLKVSPINYRSFFQTFAKYAFQVLNKNFSTRCNGGQYPKDNLEQILDSYGLLIWDTYNEDGNSSRHKDYDGADNCDSADFCGHDKDYGNQEIESLNRLYSVQIDKDLIKLDPDPTASKFFVFDKRSDMIDAVEGLKQRGNIVEISTNIEDELDFNNGNGQISPGEVVGVAVNLYNDSNSPMGGVQVLANDWDHTKELTVPKPCNTFEDAFPGDSEGAASPANDSDPATQGDCDYTTRINGNDNIVGVEQEDKEALHPVCFVQVEEDGASKWVSQSVLMDNEKLEKSQCLGGDDGSKHDCYFRAIRGADFAWYSKIDPKKNWGETVPTSSGSPKFTEANVLFFEVNKKTPPGTTFDCRFRVRFTNCKDCWIDPNNADGDDYVDHMYSGPDPFKIIHFSFTVID